MSGPAWLWWQDFGVGGLLRESGATFGKKGKGLLALEHSTGRGSLSTTPSQCSAHQTHLIKSFLNERWLNQPTNKINWALLPHFGWPNCTCIVSRTPLWLHTCSFTLPQSALLSEAMSSSLPSCHFHLLMASLLYSVWTLALGSISPCSPHSYLHPGNFHTHILGFSTPIFTPTAESHRHMAPSSDHLQEFLHLRNHELRNPTF